MTTTPVATVRCRACGTDCVPHPTGPFCPNGTHGLAAGTHRLTSGYYAGVIRRGREIVWECGERHHNRDMSTKTNGRAAGDCATFALRRALTTLPLDAEAAV